MNSFETHSGVCRACNLELVEVSVEEAVNIKKMCLENSCAETSWRLEETLVEKLKGLSSQVQI